MFFVTIFTTKRAIPAIREFIHSTWKLLRFVSKSFDIVAKVDQNKIDINAKKYSFFIEPPKLVKKFNFKCFLVKVF